MANTIRDSLFYFSSAELTNEKTKQNKTKKQKLYCCAYSDPLARAVDILGAENTYFDLRGGDCSIQKHKRVEKWPIVAGGIKFSYRAC